MRRLNRALTFFYLFTYYFSSFRSFRVGGFVSGRFVSLFRVLEHARVFRSLWATVATFVESSNEARRQKKKKKKNSN